MFNRKNLCLLAGIKLEAFKEAARIDPETGLDNLPLIADADETVGTYSKYSALDVLAVAVAVQLAAGGGLISKGMPFANAAKIVSASRGLLAEAVKRHREGHGLVFVGYVTLTEGGFNVADTLGKIALKLATDYADEVQVLTVAAPATVCSAIEARAASHGIDWKSDRLWLAE